MNTRGNFIKQLSSSIALFLFLCLSQPIAKAQEAVSTMVEPSKEVQAYMNLRFGMFIHFGVNTYTDQEWTDGTVSPSLYNPNELDTDQWCEIAQKAGMQYIVFTAKHHDGFCNWNTQYSDYSIASTPLEKDVIKELAASCKKYGLKLGLYYSLWDRHEPCYKDDYAYTEYMKNQLDELLSGYGDILMIWFDGVWDKCTGFGFDGYKAKGEEIMSIWRNGGVYNWQWDQLYAFIKHKSPGCLVMNNSGIDFTGIPLMPVDVRSGERGNSETQNNKIWKFDNKERYLPLQIEDILSRKNWFYHKGDTTVKTIAEIKALLQEAERMDANFLLNVGPMENGKLRPEDVDVLINLQN